VDKGEHDSTVVKFAFANKWLRSADPQTARTIRSVFRLNQLVLWKSEAGHGHSQVLPTRPAISLIAMIGIATDVGQNKLTSTVRH